MVSICRSTTCCNIKQLGLHFCTQRIQGIHKILLINTDFLKQQGLICISNGSGLCSSWGTIWNFI